METQFCELPKLPYGYKDLEPHMSEAQLTLHHAKHHQAYVNAANDILKKLDAARKEGTELDMKSTLKSLSFNLSGHILHSLFWENLAPPGKGGFLTGSLADALTREFGSVERFKKEFAQAAVSAEGSGWAALGYCMRTGRPMIMQIEKHNVNVTPAMKLLLVLDVWEHAYYLDYRNDRARFIESFWNIVNWKEAERRFSKLD